jgi:acyl-CoA thioester hydrolase
MDASQPWPSVDPDFQLEITVDASDIDGLGHVNNVAYLRYFERVGWAHSCDLGLDLAAYRQLDRAMVVRRHHIEYMNPGYLGDAVLAETWIIANDGKASMSRAFRLRRPADGLVLARAMTDYVCVCLANGRIRRMPEIFQERYRVPV